MLSLKNSLGGDESGQKGGDHCDSEEHFGG